MSEQDFQLHDFSDRHATRVLGLFPTLADAQAEVTRLGLTDWEIHQGDKLIDFSEQIVNPSLSDMLGGIAVLLVAIIGVGGFTLMTAAMLGPLK